MRDLLQIAKELLVGADEITKPHCFYSVYQNYFHDISDLELKILEIGTYHGDSAKILARFFEQSTIITLDNEVRGIDFTGFDNVISLQADQTDEDALLSVCERYAPEGLDIIIDDASHIGFYSLSAYNTLFPRLKPGGLYIVEDWGTGYWDDWPDGLHSSSVKFEDYTKSFPKRIVTHDYGMVGFVKYLVDQVAGPDNRTSMFSTPTRAVRHEYLHIHLGQAIVKKAR